MDIDGAFHFFCVRGDWVANWSLSVGRSIFLVRRINNVWCIIRWWTFTIIFDGCVWTCGVLLCTRNRGVWITFHTNYVIIAGISVRFRNYELLSLIIAKLCYPSLVPAISICYYSMLCVNLFGSTNRPKRNTTTTRRRIERICAKCVGIIFKLVAIVIRTHDPHASVS